MEVQNELVLRDDTETKSDRAEDVLSSSEVKKMLRCGVVAIMDGESVPMTEAMADQLIEDAHVRGDGAAREPRNRHKSPRKEPEKKSPINVLLLQVPALARAPDGMRRTRAWMFSTRRSSLCGSLAGNTSSRRAKRCAPSPMTGWYVVGWPRSV